MKYFPPCTNTVMYYGEILRWVKHSKTAIWYLQKAATVSYEQHIPTAAGD